MAETPARDYARIARWLLIATIVYNVFEGLVAAWSGLEAGSIVLLTFGADSYLEVAAASIVLWRLRFDDPEAGEEAEERAMRFVGWTFLILAAAVVFQSVYSLATQRGAEESLVGVLLLALSILLMPALSLSKLWTAARGGFPALAVEARETIACSYLSLTAFAGVAAVALFGWWWLDPVAALALVPWLVREGLENVRGDACVDGSNPCFCRPCLYGLRDCAPGAACCSPACC
ncbi:MAG: cobalt transporter [Dehalococcoidia bacterium]|nr:cobalt transporter [Dehalococcoidia bacterium]